MATVQRQYVMCLCQNRTLQKIHLRKILTFQNCQIDGAVLNIRRLQIIRMKAFDDEHIVGISPSLYAKSSTCISMNMVNSLLVITSNYTLAKRVIVIFQHSLY